VKAVRFLNRDVITDEPRTLRSSIVSLWRPTELAASGIYAG